MKETQLVQLVRLACAEAGAIVWRNNTGSLPDTNGRWVQYGLCKGSADLVGIFEGRFLAIEVKKPEGRLRKEQRQFLDIIRKNGGIAGVARYPSDVKKILKEVLTY